MKKPLLVANLLFAGLIGVALNHESMTHGQNPVSMTSTARSASQYGNGESADNKIVAGTGSSDSTALPREIPSHSDSGFLEESSCSAAKIEVTPCQ